MYKCVYSVMFHVCIQSNVSCVHNIQCESRRSSYVTYTNRTATNICVINLIDLSFGLQTFSPPPLSVHWKKRTTILLHSFQPNLQKGKLPGWHCSKKRAWMNSFVTLDTPPLPQTNPPPPPPLP